MASAPVEAGTAAAGVWARLRRVGLLPRGLCVIRTQTAGMGAEEPLESRERPERGRVARNRHPRPGPSLP